MATLTASGVNFSDGSTINGTTANTIGSYAWLGVISTTYNSTWNSTRAGSQLWPAGVIALGAGNWPDAQTSLSLTAAGQNVALSGTWRCLGRAFAGSLACSSVCGATLWVRIS